MTVHTGSIDTYIVNVLSPKPYNGRRMISLQGGFGAAVLWFNPEDAALPSNGKRPGLNVFDVYYPMSAWAAILDVLRNESPVQFSFSDSSNAAQIYTGREPVGEEELQAG